MALVECPDCKRMVSDEATSCIGCGRPLNLDGEEQYTDTPKKKDSMPTGLAIVVLLVVFGLPVYAYISCQNEAADRSKAVAAQEAKRREHGDKDSAWSMAKQFVGDKLRSPSTADYGWQSPEKQVVDLGDGSFSVTGWVDAQNGFGATVRNNFSVKLKCVGDDKWQLLEPVQLIDR